MTSEPASRYPWWGYPALALIVLALVACLCVSAILSGFGSLGDLLTAPLDWIRGAPSEPASLYEALDRGDDGAFTLGEPCDFFSAEGDVVRSTEGESEGFSRQLGRAAVVDTVLESVQGDIYLVREGEVRLQSGLPVQVSLLEDGSVSLIFEDQQATAVGRQGRSLNGVVTGSNFRLSYYLYHASSEVVAGGGYEESTSITADFSCPLIGLDPDP